MKPLSDRIEELAVQAGYDGLSDDKADLLSAAAILRSVESAPLVTVEEVGPSMAYVYFEDPPGPLKRECALVALPQQSET